MINDINQKSTFFDIKHVQLIIAWLALITFVSIATYNNLGAKSFSPDSWAFFELSQNIWSDFYKIEHFRSYWTDEYSAAFPPLWPTTIFLVNSFFSLGPDAAIYLNSIILLLIALVAENISRTSFNVRGPGVLMAIVLLLHPGFYGEVVAGRSIPIFILLGFICLRFMTYSGASYQVARPVAFGFILAAMFLTRFDGVFWVFLLLPFIIEKKLGVRRVVLLLLSYAAGVAPWVLYSVIHFDVFMVSDNSWVALALDPNAFVTDYPASTGPNIFDDLFVAIKTVIERLPELIYAIIVSPGVVGNTNLGAFVFFLFVFKRFNRLSVGSLFSSKTLPFTCVFLAIISSIPSYLLTGYFDGRYFSFMFAIIVFFAINGALQNIELRKFASILIFIFPLVSVAVVLVTSPKDTRKAQIDLPHESELFACLKLTEDHNPILVSNAKQGARLTALYGIRTAFLPRNFRENRVDQQTKEDFLSKYGFDFALDQSGKIANTFGPERLSDGPDCGLKNLFNVM